MIEFLLPAAQIFLTLALLLVAILCLRLDAKLNALRQGKDGVAAAAEQLSHAVSQADAAIKALRAHSEDATASLQERIVEAQNISNGLKFLSAAARALEPRTTQAPDNRWHEDNFRPTRTEPTSASRWDGLR